MNDDLQKAENRAEDLDRQIQRLRSFKFGLISLGTIAGIVATILYRMEYPLDWQPWTSYAIGLVGIALACVGALLNDDVLRIRLAKARSDATTYSALEQYSAAGQYVNVLGRVVQSQTTQYYQFVVANVRSNALLTRALMACGFLLLAVAVLIGSRTPDAMPLAYLSGISGIILEVLASGIVAFHRESVNLMNMYMEKLEAFSQVLLALTLIDAEINEDKKSAMRVTWFKQLVSILSSPSGAPLVPMSRRQMDTKRNSPQGTLQAGDHD